MRDLFLITNKDYTFNDLKINLEKASYMPFMNNKDSMVLESNHTDEYVLIDVDNNPESSYDPLELGEFKKTFTSPKFHHVCFRGINFVKKILKCIADRDDVLIDDTHGSILPGKEFLKICDQHDPDWDWVYSKLDSDRQK